MLWTQGSAAGRWRHALAVALLIGALVSAPASIDIECSALPAHVCFKTAGCGWPEIYWKHGPPPVTYDAFGKPIYRERCLKVADPPFDLPKRIRRIVVSLWPKPTSEAKWISRRIICVSQREGEEPWNVPGYPWVAPPLPC